MKIRFGELNNGDEFDFDGKTLIKLDGFNAVTKVARGKQNFMFFRHNLVTVKDNELETQALAASNEDENIPSFGDKKFSDLVDSICNGTETTYSEASHVPFKAPTQLKHTVLKFSMVRVSADKYSLVMQTDDRSPIQSDIQIDKSDLGQWKIELPPVEIGGMVFRGFALLQDSGHVSISRYREAIVTKRFTKDDWLTGCVVTVVFNNSAR
jgi:hypothetical protein